ncbi:hypothetical protein [Streptomyces aidingensis]|uniref:DUF1508 domain-containing protein n=1 Tax=Streptomyces aidingensis TaxID=910347 RepID=A0A1I1HRE7_9ACTN|nr:hypothetical protein [Streptomyces aidingensis]SFC23580.1 hypothetical protein SAMN05421773_102393 [Streptomyces aidingensis]
MTGGDGRSDAPVLRFQIIRCGPPARYCWRLSTQNGRAIAVSAESFTSVEDCRSGVEAACRDAGELVTLIELSPGGSSFRWHARTADGRRIASAARSYARYSTCVVAGERFRRLLVSFLKAGLPGW